MLTLIARCEPITELYGELALPFDLRIRSRLRTRLVSGKEALLKTERGAILRGGACLGLVLPVCAIAPAANATPGRFMALYKAGCCNDF